MNEKLYDILGEPYIHSNIWNFTENQVRGSFLDKTSGRDAEKYKQRIGAEIENLKKISNQLRTETQKFLGAPDNSDKAIEEKLREIAQSIGTDNLRYIQAMNKVLRSSEFQYNKALSDRVKIIQGTKLTKVFEDVMGKTLKEEVPIIDIAKKAIDELERKGFFEKKTTVDAQKETLTDYFTKKFGRSDRLIKEIQNGFKRQLSSKQGVILKIVKEQIKKQVPPDQLIESEYKKSKDQKTEERVNAIYQVFEKQFIKEFPEDEEAAETWCRAHIQEPFIKTYMESVGSAQTVGNYSEILLKNLSISVSSEGKNGILIETVGTLSEKQLRESNMMGAPTDSLLQNLTSLGATDKKQGYTDFVLTNPKTGQKARAQSKNSIAAFMNADEGEILPLQAKLYHGVQGGVANFLSMLEGSGKLENFTTINTNELNVVAYLIGNALWFSTHQSLGSNNRKRKEAVRTTTREGDSQGLNYIFESINRLLGLQVKNFLGVIIEKVGESYQVVPDLSNLFFFLGNSVYLPTYKIIDEIIKQIQFETEELASLKITIGNPSRYYDNTAEGFYWAKRFITGGLDSSKNYSDEGLLAVGRAQGKAILESAPMKSINMNFDMKKLTQTAYNFY